MQNIFITGSKSFLGEKLLKKLMLNSERIFGMDINEDREDKRLFKADICDPNIADIIPKNSIIIHLAAISKPPICEKNPKHAFDVNVNGTINLFESAKKKEAKSFIFASSEWVYEDNSNKDNIFNENSYINITGIKSELTFTKLVAEQYLRLNSNIFHVNILRFGIIYGPRKDKIDFWSAVDLIFYKIKQYDFIEIGSLNTARCFIYVDDIIEAIISTIKINEFNILNICGSKLITLEEIINESCYILNKKIKVIQKSSDNPSIRKVSNSNSISILNWKPKISLNYGLNLLNNYLNENSFDY